MGEHRFEWERFDMRAFTFSHPAAVLVLQGKKLQEFFPADSYFVADGLKLWGPFILLRGELSQPADPPLRLRDVVLARPSLQAGLLPPMEVRAALLKSL